MVLLILAELLLLKCALMLDNKVQEDLSCRLALTTKGLNQSEDKNRFYIDQHRFNINFNIYALLHFVHSEVTIETIWINITQCLLRWLHYYWRYKTSVQSRYSRAGCLTNFGENRCVKYVYHVKIDLEYHSLNQSIVPSEYLSSSSHPLTFEKPSHFKKVLLNQLFWHFSTIWSIFKKKMAIVPVTDPADFAIQQLIFDRNSSKMVETMNKTVFFNAISLV